MCANVNEKDKMYACMCVGESVSMVEKESVLLGPSGPTLWVYKIKWTCVFLCQWKKIMCVKMCVCVCGRE